MKIGKTTYLLISVFLIGLFHNSSAQRTLGLLNKTTEVAEGYTLFSPINSKEAFLIDNCGFLINKWQTNHVPGQTAYLLPNGDLLRTGRVSGFFTGGGVGGKIEIYDWDGNLKWSVTLADEKMHQHHIAHPMPNGNILTAVWYKYSKEEAIQKGFKPDKLTNGGIWSDRILELKPLPDNKVEIVWQWDFWDHTIQNLDPLKNEFGVVSNHPELLDVNFFEDPGANDSEWIHLNSLDYHPELDQILLSSKYHNEIYIIDHSTSIAEAKSHSGGKYGKGGDFLYRWGNPRSYGRGDQSKHWLFGQHDVQWIDKGLPGENKILLFNNGSNRLDELYSSVEVIQPPLNENGAYTLIPNKAFGPDFPEWKYQSEPRTDFYSSRISGAQRLKNGNTLICEGNKGNFFEVNMAGNLVWKYENPINNFGAGTQGSIPFNNEVFKISKYPIDYSAFVDKSISGNKTLEENIDAFECLGTSHVMNISKENGNILTSFPNPAESEIHIDTHTNKTYAYKIIDLLGRTLIKGTIVGNDTLDISSINSGTYILQIKNILSSKLQNLKFIKM